MITIVIGWIIFIIATVVLGVPTVKRESQSYLLPTLASLIESMNEEEKNDTMIIVFVAEVLLQFIWNLNERITNFAKKKKKKKIFRIDSSGRLTWTTFRW